MNDISNENLLADYYSGERAGLNTLYKRLGDDLYNIAVKLTGAEQDARDYCQQAWEEILRNPEKYAHKIVDGSLNLRAYMIMVIRNKFIDDYRRNEFQTELPIEELLEEKNTADPLSMANFYDLLSKAEKCLSKLNAIYREAYVLSRVAGYSLAEIAKLLNINPETVKTRRRIAYKHMKICLVREGEEPYLDFLVNSYQSPEKYHQITQSKSVVDEQARGELTDEQIIDALVKESYREAPFIIRKLLY